MNKKIIVGIGLFIVVVSLVAYLFFYDDILGMYEGWGGDDELDDFSLDDFDGGTGAGGDDLNLDPPVSTNPDAIEQSTSTDDQAEGGGAASAAANEAAES